MSLIKKLFVFSLVITTVLSFNPFNVKAAGSYGAGSLLALQGVQGSAVYYIGSDGMKYVFPDSKTYATWYDNFNDVVRVDVAELDMYPDGGAMTYRAGTKLVTHENTAKIYAVGPGGLLHWIPTAEIAEDLYGANWASRVLDVIPGYFSSSYVSGADLSDMYPSGTLLQMGENMYYVDGTSVRPFADADAFEANNFAYGNLITVTSVSAYTSGTSITGEETALSGFMPAEGSGPVVSGGNLTVAIASGTPASGMVVGGAARVPFTKLALTTGSQGVTIDTMVVQRGGIGQDGAFDSIDILDGTTMLPYDANSKTFNSNHQATFTKDLVIPANTTKYVYLAANMVSQTTIGTSYAGEAPALGLAAVTLVGSGSVGGSLPVYGNTQTLNGTIAIGTVGIQRGSYGNATSTSIEVGKTDYTFFSFQVNPSSVEDVTFNQVAVYQEGTAVLGDDITNIELLKDGVKVADGVVDGKYVTFSGINTVIPKGQTYQYAVRADVDGGSLRTVDLGIYRTTDLLVTGNTYGYNITPSYSGAGSSYTSSSVYNKPVLSDNQFTMSNGTLTVERGNIVGSENITLGNDQTLGSFKFTVKGEEIDVTALTLTIASSATATIEDALAGVKLVDSNGTTVAGPTDVTNNALTVAFTDTFTLPVGESEYKVVGNIANNGGWAANDTIYASISTPATAITATGVITGNSITSGTATAINTNTQTVKAASLTVTKDTLPTTSTVIAGAQDVVLGSWTFDTTNSGEDIRITSLVFAASSTDATNLTVYNGVYGSGGVAMSPINSAPTVADGASSTFAFDEPIVITKKTSKTIQLVGDINSSATTGQSAQFGLTDVTAATNASVVAYGVTTGNRATLSLTADNGATLTYSAAGAVTVSTYNNPSNAIARAGATGVTFGSVKLDALYENLDLDQLIVYVADGALTGTATGNYADVNKVYIYDGTTLLASNAIPSTGLYTFNFDNGTLTVPVDGSKTLTIKADLSTISQVNDVPGTPAADIAFGFGGTDGFKFTGTSSNTTATETYNGSTSSAMILHKALPTVTVAQSSAALGAATTMANGASDLYAFKVTADAAGSEVLLYRATFEIATGGGATVTVTNCYLKDSDGNTVGAAATPTDVDGAPSYVSYVFNNPDISAGNTKEALMVAAGSSETYKLNCTLANAASGDNIAVALVGDVASSTLAASFGTPSATGQNNADAWAAVDKGNFVWSDNFKNRGLATDGANATAWGQWYNGYLVSGLGTSGTTTAYTIGWSS
ncbi:MAG: hypothetical protein WCS88_00390 [Patescibacteria group bacterium]|jgi:hypothetical protein